MVKQLAFGARVKKTIRSGIPYSSIKNEIHELAVEALGHCLKHGYDHQKCGLLVNALNKGIYRSNLISWFCLWGELHFIHGKNVFKRNRGKKISTIDDAVLNPFYKSYCVDNGSEGLIIKAGEGYIYILSNKCIEGMLKVGVTDRHPKIRALELSNTSVPEEFIVENSWKCTTESMYQLEKNIHTRLSAFRHNPNREFFKIELAECILHVEHELSDHDRKIANKSRLEEKRKLGLVGSLSNISKMTTRR